MKKLLIMGVNTRELVKSSLRLPHETYSVSYYSTFDFKPPHKEKHILKQGKGISCGIFEEKYDPNKLLELSEDFLEEVDNIILSSGISIDDFTGPFKRYKKKIIGNHEVNNIEDKYKFYKKIKNEYNTPKTFKIKNNNDEEELYGEIIEIIKQHEDLKFIMKPLQGSGGYGINYIKYNVETKDKINETTKKKDNILDNEYELNNYKNCKKCDLILQEYIEGISISSSLLSTKNEVKSIIISRMLTETDFGLEKKFKYCGNIVPFNSISFDNNLLLKQNDYNISENTINNISENLIAKFNLIGSNGIDMILNKKLDSEPWIIEINPRLQGTYECVEELLNINLLEGHLKACEGELIKIPKVPENYYSIKRVLYSKDRIVVGDISNINYVYDIPYKGVIIEKDEPLITIKTPSNKVANCEKIIENTIEKVRKELYPIKDDKI
ncbi:hypothetical protein SDC9_03486 [bioreactor metagenome]|uniref:ATP-grasp domain-containing protein n=1 Tax=bioreactor metagenome TaxID=1076179 RepID=A0A644SWE4_9ZZZZ|nr:ATP-grasp domain-containing protein [Methanobrevibacter sp.]MEA4956107.1 ATP-grasp domain-containing protein [Methanobrevibacter sp.]